MPYPHKMVSTVRKLSISSQPEPGDDPRTFELVTLGSSSIEIEVMDYVEGAANLQPLIILSPIDFPFPPSVTFCEIMKQNGFRVVYIRRPGFGGTPALPGELLTEANIKNGAALMAEAALLLRVITQLKLRDSVLLGISSANAICYRLCLMHPDISLTVFSHPIFNQETIEAIRPQWVQPMARQIIFTKRGMKLAASGLRYYIKRDPLSFYNQFYSKSSTDLKYRRENEEDFLAAAKFVNKITAETMFYEVVQTLTNDTFLRDELFRGTKALVMAGSETTQRWLRNAESEAKRLSVPFVQEAKGGILAAYSSPEALIRVIEEHST